MIKPMRGRRLVTSHSLGMAALARVTARCAPEPPVAEVVDLGAYRIERERRREARPFVQGSEAG